MNALNSNAREISECLVEQHCSVIKQLYSQLNVLRRMKQNTLCPIKTKNGSLPQFNRCIFGG